MRLTSQQTYVSDIEELKLFLNPIFQVDTPFLRSVLSINIVFKISLFQVRTRLHVHTEQRRRLPTTGCHSWRTRWIQGTTGWLLQQKKTSISRFYQHPIRWLNCLSWLTTDYQFKWIWLSIINGIKSLKLSLCPLNCTELLLIHIIYLLK